MSGIPSYFSYHFSCSSVCTGVLQVAYRPYGSWYPPYQGSMQQQANHPLQYPAPYEKRKAGKNNCNEYHNGIEYYNCKIIIVRCILV